jgi:hypothetical protein
VSAGEGVKGIVEGVKGIVEGIVEGRGVVGIADGGEAGGET